MSNTPITIRSGDKFHFCVIGITSNGCILISSSGQKLVMFDDISSPLTRLGYTPGAYRSMLGSGFVGNINDDTSNEAHETS